MIQKTRYDTFYSWRRKQKALPESGFWYVKTKPSFFRTLHFGRERLNLTRSHMGSAFFFYPHKRDHSSQRVLSTSYTAMTDNLTDSEQEKVFRVSSRTSKNSSSCQSQGMDRHATRLLLVGNPCVFLFICALLSKQGAFSTHGVHSIQDAQARWIALTQTCVYVLQMWGSNVPNHTFIGTCCHGSC